jgi:prepilin-type N-terminal cleavage/methylation domain-containing protein
MLRRSQAGDTLVEVMIALAIIGAVLGAAYATATRSLRVGRQAQERTEALKLVEGQLERLKYRYQQDKTAFDANYRTAGYCLDDQAVKQPDTDAVCQDRSGLYDLRFSYDAGNQIFISEARWQRIGSSDNDSINVRYRL